YRQPPAGNQLPSVDSSRFRPAADVRNARWRAYPRRARPVIRSENVMLLALAVLVTLAAPRAAAPVHLDAKVADSLKTAIEKDRADTRDWLKTAKTSYLATILRRDFDDKTTLTLGSAEGVDVRVDDPEIRPRHLRVTVVGDSFRVEG